jgi:hypothetical protein
LRNVYLYIRKMKTYYQFLFEKIIISPETLLDTIKAKVVSSNDVFETNIDKYTDLETLFDDNDFNSKLKSKGYKKDNLELTKEYETFLKNTLNIKYFLVFKDNQNELERPKYIFLQVKKGGNWGKIGLYEVNDEMKNFYDLLTNKTIEINFNNKIYTYTTANGGNDWTLQNGDQDETFKKIMRSEEINNTLKTSGASVQEID